MSRWTQWQFVAPRLMLCVVAVLGAQFVAGLITRLVAVQSGTELFGSQVDISSARVSMTNGHVTLSGMQIADPRNAGATWLTANGCELEIAGTPLLYRQTIIEKARLTGMELGVRSDSDLERREGIGNKPTVNWFADNLQETAGGRLNSIDERFKANYLKQLESVKRTTAFCTRFPDTIAQLEARGEELASVADKLEQELQAASLNSLRHDQKISNVPAKLGALRAELDEISAKFAALPEQLERERRTIVAARRQDEQFLHAKLQAEAIDQELLNAYLLRDRVAEPLNETISWLQAIRALTGPGQNRNAPNRRGEYVLFTGMRQAPDFLIRTLEVDGTARVLGEPVGVRGIVTNITTTPAIHGEPIQARLSARGARPLEIRASIDRTNGRVVDELFVDCSNLTLAAHSLGRRDQLQLNVAPSTASLSVSLRVEGDKLSGEVQLIQKQLKMTPSLAGELGELPIAAPLTATLSQVSSVATRVSLTGTVDQPSCTLWSNLGPAVAEAMDRALRKHTQEHARIVLAEARRHVDERLAAIERQVTDQQARFAIRTASLPHRLEMIARSHTRRERISVEQLGRRLPSTSVLR